MRKHGPRTFRLACALLPSLAIGCSSSSTPNTRQPDGGTGFTTPDGGEAPVVQSLALNITEVHRRHPECFDEEATKYLEGGEDPFGFKRLQYVREASESKKLNDLPGPFVVISSFKTEEEAVRRANDTTYGLGSSVSDTSIIHCLDSEGNCDY